MFYSFRFQKMTKTAFRFFYSFLLFFPEVSKLHSYNFFWTIYAYHLHQNNKSVICYVVFLFWDHDGGTGPKMEPMLDFNESAKNN